MSRSFPEDKFEIVPANSKADIYVINTCSVTDAADKKCRQAINKFSSASPGSFIAVVGCYAQLNPNEISSIPGVDLVLGTNEKFSISEYLSNTEKKKATEVHSCDICNTDSFNSSFSVNDRTRSFLKVQDGCDYGCAYCTIPLARGRSRNPRISSIVDEAEKIAENGIKEIVITGVNIGDFGKTTGDSFIDLLRDLVKIKGIERYRLSSIEPNLLTEELIEFIMYEEKILPHFHIPLQSGSNKILGLMRRRYTRDLFGEKVESIRKRIPFAGIGADIIVGFPGESDNNFEDTYSFLKELPLSYLHVFKFSERPDTVAINLPDKVSHADKEARSKRLITLSENKNMEFIRMNIGQVTKVLFEKSRKADLISGFTSNYLRAEHQWDSKLAGKIEKVKLKTISQNGNVSVEIIS